MEWKSEADSSILKHRLLLCCAFHPHLGIDAPCPEENTKNMGRRKPGFYYKRAPLRKWKALPHHGMPGGQGINAFSKNTKGLVGPYHLTGGESLILLLRMESRIKIGCEGPWKLRQLTMIYMIKVCQETLGVLQNCLSVPFKDELCFVSVGKKKSDIVVVLPFLILAVFINFLCQLQILYRAYHKKY